MFGAFKVGSILGITIRVHVLLVLLIVLVAFQGATGTAELLSLVLLFPILLLHELGHSLVARRFGIGVVDITLWPLGGMARMTHIPEVGRIEGLIAIAGPAVNFVLAALILPVFLLFFAGEPRTDAAAVTWSLLVMNLALGLFNLIPAFPTDGGRLLRALLSSSADWVTATRRAVIVGRVFAVLIGVGGFALGNWVAPVLAAWLWWMGSIELEQVVARHRAPDRVVETPLEPEVAGDWSSQAAAPPRPRAPLTDEEIERLERWRGRLRSYGDGS